MLLLHAIGPAEGRTIAPPEEGLRAGWAVRAVCASGLVAWASACADVPPLTREDLLAHHRLAEQALAAGLRLPARFSTWVADEHALRELLERRREGLLAALERVQGRVELAVTVRWTTTAGPTEPAAPATSPGRRYLEQRRQRYASADRQRAEAQRLASRIEADPGVVEARHTVSDLGLSSAVLVSQEHALAVRKRLQSPQEGVRILVNGPWPPYSFVSLEG